MRGAEQAQGLRMIGEKTTYSGVQRIRHSHRSQVNLRRSSVAVTTVLNIGLHARSANASAAAAAAAAAAPARSHPFA
jgi:hypothetical protein